MRQSKALNGDITTHIWDGTNIISDLDNLGAITYLRGVNLLASDDGSSHKFYLYNGHGDVVQLADGSGEILWCYEYDAFGNEKAIDGQDAAVDENPFRYCGEYFDSSSGTYYLRARYYQPGTGRFINEDPIRDGYNWFAYCGGNPVLFFVGPWINAQIGRIIPEDFPLAVTPVPTGKKNSSTPLGGWIYTINNDYAHKKEAFELVEFLNRPQISAECTAGMSGTRDAFNFAPMNEEKTLRFRGALEGARPIMQDGCPLGTAVEEGFGAAFNQILFEPTANLTSDAAFLNASLQRILDANKPR